MTRYATQSDRMLELLRRRPCNGLELRVEHGIGAPNSRRSDLENRGHVIVCRHVKGKRGPASYVYELIFDAERADAATLEEPAGGTPAPSARSSSDDAFLTSHGSEPSRESSAEGERIPPSAEPAVAEPEPLFVTAPPGRSRELWQ